MACAGKTLFLSWVMLWTPKVNQAWLNSHLTNLFSRCYSAKTVWKHTVGISPQITGWGASGFEWWLEPAAAVPGSVTQVFFWLYVAGALTLDQWLRCFSGQCLVGSLSLQALDMHYLALPARWNRTRPIINLVTRKEPLRKHSLLDWQYQRGRRQLDLKLFVWVCGFVWVWVCACECLCAYLLACFAFNCARLLSGP